MADAPPVIWLNGAFGAGKTTIARALAAQVPEALLLDPEGLGMLLREVVPPALRPSGDFQDLPLWRRLTRATLDGLLADYGRPLIVPMTLARADYFEETVGALRRSGTRVHHFTLLASRATLRRRLLLRPAWPGSTLWALGQVERCVAALQAPLFGEHLATDGVSIDALVATIRRAAAI